MLSYVDFPTEVKIMKLLRTTQVTFLPKLTLIVQVVNERKRLKYEKVIDEDNIPCPGEPKNGW